MVEAERGRDRQIETDKLTGHKGENETDRQTETEKQIMDRYRQKQFHTFNMVFLLHFSIPVSDTSSVFPLLLQRTDETS